ncbi:MAG TPA: hypothetical protein VF901_19180 [Bradyrhizobium sp.]
MAGLGVVTAGTPLIPAFPISVEPIGIPVRPAPPGEIVEGDDENVPLPLVVAAPPQGDVPLPDIAIAVVAGLTPVPLMPPGGVALGIPAMPPPSKVPVELGTADTPDVEPPDVELPATEHGMLLPVLEPNIDVPDGSGLRPPVASPVAPIGMPAGPTGRLPWMPSGEVGSMPGEEVDVCAIAALPLRRTATIVAMNQRPMVSSYGSPGEQFPGAALIGRRKHQASIPASGAEESLAACRPRNLGIGTRAESAMKHRVKATADARNALPRNCRD